MAMNLPEKIKSNKPKISHTKGFVSFNLLFIKGNLSDPETQRLMLRLTFQWLMLLIALLVAIIFPDSIPSLKSIPQLIQHLK